MIYWLKESLIAWAISSLGIGTALTLMPGSPWKTLNEKLLGPFAVGAGAAVLSALPTAIIAIAIYAPLRGLLLTLPRPVLLSASGLGFTLLVWMALRLPAMTGERDVFMGLFWMWVGAVSAGFLAVSATYARMSA